MSDQGDSAKRAGKPVPRVRLRDVARVAQEGRLRLPMAARALHRGPFPLYAENCATYPVDDYALEAGGTVMVSAIGQVLTSAGTIQATLETGRCAATEHVHPLVPRDPADAPYLWRVITTSPQAGRVVVGSPQLRELTEPALLSLAIPWPSARDRAAFVHALDELDERRRAAADRIPALYRRGDAAFAEVARSSDDVTAVSEACAPRRGTDVPASARGAGKPVRVEGPSGSLGRCDEALADDGCVVVGPCARRLLVHYAWGASHPIAETAFVTAADARVSLPVLLFALRAAGATDRVRAGERLADVARHTMEDLPSLPLRLGTAAARAAFDEVGWAILAQIRAAHEEMDRLDAARAAVIADAFPSHGGPVVSLEEASAMNGDLPRAADNSAAPDEDGGEGDGGATAGGVRLDAHDVACLGRLRDVLASTTLPALSADDLAWELGPLVTLRCCLAPADWAAVVAGSADEASVVAAIDGGLDAAARDDLLAFMPNLSYRSSLLSPAQLGAWVRALDAVPAAQIGAENLRALFARASEATAPAALAVLMEQVARDVAPDACTAYVPFDSDGTTLDAIARLDPTITLRAQCDDFSHLLAAAMVRAVQTREAGGLRGGLGAAVGEALTDDQFSDWRASLVMAVLPDNEGAWTETMPDADDPRWAYGRPPRARANYAWIQAALSHQEAGGATVLAVANAALHATTGSEPTLRRKIVEARRVRCVVALPAGIFADGRDAMSVVVLGDEGCAPETLFVDATGLGARVAGAHAGDAQPTRVVPPQVVHHIRQACDAWLSDGAAPYEAGFARVVTTEEILARGATLAPWAFA